jgi:hypothetical protein
MVWVSGLLASVHFLAFIRIEKSSSSSSSLTAHFDRPYTD